MRLGAIGPGSAWLLVMEFFAWLWLRFQPKSSLSQWYQTRFAADSVLPGTTS